MIRIIQSAMLITLIGFSLYPTDTQAAVCVFLNENTVIDCMDSPGITDAECTADFTNDTGDGSFQSDGYTKVFDSNIETCAIFEQSLPSSTPAPEGASTSTISSGSSEIATRLTSLNKLSARSVPELIGRGIRLFTGFFGSIALLMVIYGGLKIMLAQGQADNIKQGANIIVWASIGLVTMMLSYVLVNFVFGAIT